MVRLLKLSLSTLWLPCLAYAVVTAVLRSTPELPQFTLGDMHADEDEAVDVFIPHHDRLALAFQWN